MKNLSRAPNGGFQQAVIPPYLRIPRFGVLVLAVAVAGGCLSPPAQEAEWLTPTQLPANAASLNPGTTSSHRIRASINEYIGFLFVIRPHTAVEKPALRFEVSATRGPDPIQTELARVHPVQIHRFPGWHVRYIPPAQRTHQPLDVLVPLEAPQGGMPPRLEAGKTYVFWAELMAPKATPPGTHKVPLTLEANGKWAGGLDIEFIVWPMVLPDEGAVAALAQLDHTALFRHHSLELPPTTGNAGTWHELPEAQRFDHLLMSTLRMFQRHRVFAVLPLLSPKSKLTAQGRLEVDWSGYDQVVAPLMDGTAFANRVAYPAWPAPLSPVQTASRNASFFAPGSEALMRTYTENCFDHFAERGWSSRAFALGESSDIAGTLRQGFPVAVQGFPQDMGPYGWHGFVHPHSQDEVSIWITDAQFYDPGTMAAQRAAGKQTWLSVDRPPFSGNATIHARPADTLALGWQARWLQAGVLWMGHAAGQNDTNPSDPLEFLQSNPGALIVPGGGFGLSQPVPTLRLKRLRESLQQVAYARLLSQHGLGNVVDSLNQALVERAGTQAYRTHFADGRTIGWAHRPEAFELARIIMAVSMLDYTGADLDPDLRLERDLLAGRFKDLTSGVEVLIDGTRIRIAGTPARPRFKVEIWCTISNRSQNPLDAAVMLDPAPAECTLADSPQIITMGPARSSRISFMLDCDPSWVSTFRGTNAGVLVEDRASHRVTRTPWEPALILAEHQNATLRIDGDHSDWPAAAANVASGFQLIAGPCDGDDACLEPALKTFAFARRDAENLYLAVNSQAAQRDGTTSRRSVVEYDDTIPVDEEDLVEILIDPLNGGTRAPMDLFHIVVKRSGVYSIERGAGIDSRVVPRRPWQAAINIASRERGDRWTAEIQIPLAAFDRPGTPRGEIWGLNVTHYNAARQEFSTWSGARHNAYDPLSLGNLFLP